MDTNEDLTQEVENAPSPLYSVTLLSKYLAMVLFTIMPFLGGWIGYTYAPEKVVEVERIVLKEEDRDKQTEPDSKYVWSRSNSFSEVTSVTQEQRVALDIGGYSEGVLLFTIGSRRLIDDSRLFIDYLHFDETTGLVVLKDFWGEGTADNELMRLYEFKDGIDLETQIEDIILHDEQTESVFDNYIVPILQSHLNNDQLEGMTFRSFCQLGVTEDPVDYPGRKIAHLTYDYEMYGDELGLNFAPLGPCRGNLFIVFEDLIIQSFSVPIDAAQPKIRNDTVGVDYKLSYINSLTGEKVYKYDFLEE